MRALIAKRNRVIRILKDSGDGRHVVIGEFGRKERLEILFERQIDEIIERMLARRARQFANGFFLQRTIALGRRLRHRQDRKSTTSELQSLMRISYAVFCLKKKKKKTRILRINKTTK